jgi:hypothetical protein
VILHKKLRGRRVSPAASAITFSAVGLPPTLLCLIERLELLGP